MRGAAIRQRRRILGHAMGPPAGGVLLDVDTFVKNLATLVSFDTTVGGGARPLRGG